MITIQNHRDGSTTTVEAIDINVYRQDEGLPGIPDFGPVQIAVYMAYQVESGHYETNTGGSLQSWSTDFSLDNWGEDEWYMLIEPSDADALPQELRDHVNAWVLAPQA